MGSSISPNGMAMAGRSAHPNDLDRKRIERSLKARQRYRYVVPRVVPVSDGYRIESPCCSRKIDAEGGVIDVALLLFLADEGRWRLFRKNHADGGWEIDRDYDRLAELLEHLNADPQRRFWQ
jgi:hypothetical protein